MVRQSKINKRQKLRNQLSEVKAREKADKKRGTKIKKKENKKR